MVGSPGFYYTHNSAGSREDSDPPLILIHGAGGSHLHWSPTTRRLSGRNTYAIDLPGHGRSPGDALRTIPEYVEVLASWIKHEAIRRPVLIGHSMGGAIALSAGLTIPEALAGLVLVGTSDHLPVNPTLLGMLGRDETFTQAVDLIMKWSFSPSSAPRLLELCRKRMLQVPRLVLFSDYRACEQFDGKGRLGEIRLPTLVICGADDKMTPARAVRRLAQSIADSRLAIIEAAGHMVMLEQPPAVDEAVLDFLAREAL